jgi:hypothetical protein
MLAGHDRLLPSRHGEATGHALVAERKCVLAATPAMFIGASDDVV